MVADDNQQLRERLLEWMREKSFDLDTLAEATGDTYSNVHMMLKGNRRLNDAFKWRFAQSFGWEEASRVFGVQRNPLLDGGVIHAIGEPA